MGDHFRCPEDGRCLANVGEYHYNDSGHTLSGFDEGFQLGARVEHGAAVAVVAGALLDILGKDAGDGIINLGAAGYWSRYGGEWEPAQWAGPNAEPISYREGIAGASK